MLQFDVANWLKLWCSRSFHRFDGPTDASKKNARWAPHLSMATLFSSMYLQAFFSSARRCFQANNGTYLNIIRHMCLNNWNLWCKKCVLMMQIRAWFRFDSDDTKNIINSGMKPMEFSRTLGISGVCIKRCPPRSFMFCLVHLTRFGFFGFHHVGSIWHQKSTLCDAGSMKFWPKTHQYFSKTISWSLGAYSTWHVRRPWFGMVVSGLVVGLATSTLYVGLFIHEQLTNTVPVCVVIHEQPTLQNRASFADGFPWKNYLRLGNSNFNCTII